MYFSKNKNDLHRWLLPTFKEQIFTMNLYWIFIFLALIFYLYFKYTFNILLFRSLNFVNLYNSKFYASLFYGIWHSMALVIIVAVVSMYYTTYNYYQCLYQLFVVCSLRMEISAIRTEVVVYILSYSKIDIVKEIMYEKKLT